MIKPGLNNKLSRLRVDQPWRVATFNGHDDPGRRAIFDEQLLDLVLNGDSGPCLCINRAPRCLVATVRESRMPGFAGSCRSLSAQGWPVIVRCTGGSCVPQGPGVITFSMVHRKVRGWYLDDAYQLLCDFLSIFLASYGLSTTTGEVPGSFCDGRYNLQVGGQKLVGTAQRWAGGSRDNAAVLAHACLLVDLDLVEATEKINSLYRMCGNSLQFTADSCVTLRACLDGPGQKFSEAFVADVERHLASAARAYFKVPVRQ